MEEITDEDLILNIKKLNKFNFAKQISLLGKYNNRSSWFIHEKTSGIIVNAAYNSLLNYIVFPAGIQQIPFYDLNRPWYLNFGAIGSIIGHEITHGFDDKGSQRDMYGKIFDWWTVDTKRRFQEKTQCFVDQYNNYKIYQINETVNGKRTLGENIADNGGLRQAYQAYQNWKKKYGKEKLLPGLPFDSSQLFFLSFGNMWCYKYSPAILKYRNLDDVHATAKYRVIGSLSNMEEFAQSFNCKKNSPMNPEKKCVIW